MFFFHRFPAIFLYTRPLFLYKKSGAISISVVPRLRPLIHSLETHDRALVLIVGQEAAPS